MTRSGHPQLDPTAADASLPNAPGPVKESNDCPICILIQLTGTSLPSAAPVLLLPTQFIWTQLDTPVGMPSSASLHLSFNARAPPVASHQRLTAMSPGVCEGRAACRHLLRAHSARVE